MFFPFIFLKISFPFKVIHSTNSGRVYGTEPKCIRVKEIHRLFYYLVYGYDGELINDQLLVKEALKKENPFLDDESLENLPDIYQVMCNFFTYQKKI